MDAQMMVATTIASFGGAATGWLAARWIYRSEVKRMEALCGSSERASKLWKGVADDACAELRSVSEHTMARHQAMSAASVKGWRTRKQRKARDGQAHEPNCAVALNGRHECSCGAGVKQ